MKKSSYTLLCAAVLVCAASCQKESLKGDGLVPVTISASLPDTKVNIDGVSPKWQSGDRIAVFTTDGTLCPAFSTSDSGSQSATFSGSKPDGSTLGVAVYPYESAVSMSGSTVTISVPAEQDGSAATAVMAAPAGESFNFVNLLSVVKVSVPSSLDIRRIEILRDSPASGNATLNAGSMTLTVPSTGARSVAAVSSSAFSGDVYISMLPGSSKKLDMVLTNGSGKMVLISKDLTSGATAGRIKNLGSVPSSLSFSDVALIGSSTSAQSYSAATQPSKPQVTNGDFETWTLDGEHLPNNWNSFQTIETSGAVSLGAVFGLGPYDSSNRQVKRSSDKRPGSSGSYSCSIWSRKITSVIAQGNLTTGRIYASNVTATGTGNYNYTDQDGSATINKKSNPYHMEFAGRPDSLAIWVKFAPAGNDTQHPYAKVEVILHDKVDYKSGYNASDCTGGTHKIAEATDMNIANSNGKWKRLSVPFNYGYSTTPSFALINIATNAYPGGGSVNDYLYVDDLEMIYNLYNLKTDTTGWATLCLGYDALIPSGVTVYYVDKVACGYASLVPVSAGSILPKNTAVLVKGSAGTTYSFNGRAADLNGHSKASVSGNLLKGTLVDCSKPSGTCRVLSGQSTSALAAFGEFSGSTIKANTAWLTE